MKELIITPRRAGKTTYVIENAKPGDIVIVPNVPTAVLMRERIAKTGKNIAVMTPKAFREQPTPWKGKHIWLDELCYIVMADNDFMIDHGFDNLTCVTTNFDIPNPFSDTNEKIMDAVRIDFPKELLRSEHEMIYDLVKKFALHKFDKISVQRSLKTK